MLIQSIPKKEPYHIYYAAADVLSADFEQPVRERIQPRAYVKLPADGNHQFKQAGPFRLDGVISYQSGYAQVAGYRNANPAGGFITLASAGVEGLNLLDVVTADRVVAQIATGHPPYDPDNEQTDAVPSVTFLGTRFDNLRICGHNVEIERHVDILGPKPADDKSYFEDDGVLSRVSQQYANINSAKDLPEWASEQYSWDKAAVQRQGQLKCSLVNRVTGAPGISFGHVIDVPHFGWLFLAELTVRREKNGGPDKYSFHLAMLRLELNYIAQGNALIASVDVNSGSGAGGGNGGGSDTHGSGEGAKKREIALPSAPPPPVASDTVHQVENSGQRVVNTYFQTDGVAVPISHSLVTDREYSFCLNIGPPSALSNVLAAQPIPEAYLEPFYEEGGINLRVCLFSQQFRLANDSQWLRLPRSGPTGTLQFSVSSPTKLGLARLRASIYHRQNLLQSILVTAQINSALQTNLEHGNVAEVEFSLSDHLQIPDDLPDRTLNILVNENPEGTHTFAVLGENVKKQFSIDRSDAEKLARQQLLAICSRPDKDGNPEYLYRDDDNSGDESKLVSDLKELAFLGWNLYCRFSMEPLDEDFESKLEDTLKGPSSIQIASTRSARYVYPWSVVYDKPLLASNSVCSEALNLLRSGGPPGFLDKVSCPQNGCANADDNTVVCPFRFWGFKHSIEQPPNAGEILKEISISGQPKCVIGAHCALSGTQHRKEIERECKLKADYSETKTDIGTSLASTTPHVVYFYCHGGRTLSAPWLGVGKDEHIESSDLKAWKVKWPQTRPLVFINGCHTVDLSPDDLLDFVTAFNWTRASGVIGTEIAIPESLAREFGRDFLQQFLSGQNVRDVIRRLRLRLLEKYNLLGLAYTPYCYGELHVVRNL